MSDIVKQFSEIARAIEEDRGPLVLFGLFVRADTPTLIDVVVSASWLDGEARSTGMRYVAKKIGKVLRPREMVALSRIAPMETRDKEVRRLVKELGEVHHVRAIENFVFAGATIVSARIMSAHLPKRKGRVLAATA